MKLQLEIIEVENGYVVFEGLSMSNMGFDRKKYVASTVYQLLDVVKGLAEKALSE